MANILIKTAVRTRLKLTSREKALRQCEEQLRSYAELAEGLSKEAGQRCVEVPPMLGVDEDMRRWSFFMILEHNAIVNRSITATVVQLARREPLSGAAKIDPRHDVMPSPEADASQVEEFADSIRAHQAAVKELPELRGTGTSPHPLFGEFDAHLWNAMFSFHLAVHLPQAQYVVERARKETGGS